MAFLTTSSAISARIHGIQMRGTGPHWVPDELLDDIKDTLEAGDVTVSTYVCEHMAQLPSNDTTFEVPIFRAPTAVTVQAIKLVTGSDLVGADTNYLTLTVYNRGTAGAGTAQLVSKTMNAAAGTIENYTPTTLGAVSNASLTAGQVLTIAKGTAGSGLSFPLSSVIVEYAAT